MRIHRGLAAFLGLASGGFAAFALLQQAIDRRSLVLIVAAALVLLLIAVIPGKGAKRLRVASVLLSVLSSLLVLAALVLQLDEDRMLIVRASLSVLLLGGLLLTMLCVHALRRPPVRRGMHNYFDAPRR